MPDIFVLPRIVAREMVRRGIDPQKIRNDNFEDWTDTLVNALEFLYGLERKVCTEIKGMQSTRKKRKRKAR